MSKNWAICIGINDYYNLKPLQYAVNDAEAIGRFFRKEMAFEDVIFFAKNAPAIKTPRGEMRSEPTYANLKRFFRERFKAPFLSVGDNLWFFFAGHGELHGGHDYLMPMDVDPGNVEETALKISEITAYLRNSGADNTILLLDACRNQGRRAPVGVGTDEQPGMVTFYACSPRESSYEIEELAQGAFTYSLLEGFRLQGANSRATVQRIDQYLSHQVPMLNQRYKKPVQTPYTAVEPLSKNYLILLPQRARLEDVQALKNEAFRAETKDEWDFAQQLWIRILAASRVDQDAIAGLQRIALKRVQPNPVDSDSSSTPADSRRVEKSVNELLEPPTTNFSLINPPKTLTEYEQAVLAVSSDLEKLRNFSENLGLDAIIAMVASLLEKIQTHTFSVAIVGEFKRGKSTFINALIGKELLPMSILPCSATVTRITYGDIAHAEIIYKSGQVEEIKTEQLSNYITKLTPEAEAKANTIQAAIVYEPVQYCRNGVDLIDTPGINYSASMTELTLRTIQKVDVVILMMTATAMLSAYERDLLENKLLTNDFGKTIFIINAIDHFKDSADLEQALQNVEERIEKMTLKHAEERFGKGTPEYKVYRENNEKPKVFGVSSYQALEAKLTNDSKLLAQSRFSEFEKFLDKYLAQEHGAALLHLPANQIIAITSEIVKVINIRENSLEKQQLESQNAYEVGFSKFQELHQSHREKIRLIDNSPARVMEKIEYLINQLEDRLKYAASGAIDTAAIDSLKRKEDKEKSFRQLTSRTSEALQEMAQVQLKKIQDKLVEWILQQEEISSVELHDSINLTLGFSIHKISLLLTNYLTVFIRADPSLLAFRAVTQPIQFIMELSSPIDTFKSEFKRVVYFEIEQWVKEEEIEQSIRHDVSAILEVVKQRIYQELESLQDAAQAKLEEMREQKYRDESVASVERRKLADMNAEVQNVLFRAQHLSKEIAQESDRVVND